MPGISAIVSCGAPSRSRSILGSPELGGGPPERLFKQPGKAAGIGEAVSGRDCADRCRPVGVSEHSSRRLQADAAQRRHRRHTAAAAKGELQRTHAAARASRRLGERDRFLRLFPEELLDLPHVAQSSRRSPTAMARISARHSACSSSIVDDGVPHAAERYEKRSAHPKNEIICRAGSFQSVGLRCLSADVPNEFASRS